mmetsp:Transcript_2413/g.7103  ORF Transcript_2413/g.7103 Transcript_2413/m.7103 type:complete len:510 (-) Transcript_2413:40-1569(-)
MNSRHRQPLRRALPLLVLCCGFAAAELPQVISDAAPCLKEGMRERLEKFFQPNGPASRFRVALETSCVEGDRAIGSRSAREWKKPQRSDLHDSKWGLDALLPLLIKRSPWFGGAGVGARANATLVVFRPRQHARSALSRCVQTVDPREARRDLWFTASTDRGRCCDGGQLRDPRLLRHHFLQVSSERPGGEWLFRETGQVTVGRSRHSWRAPPTRATAPRLRCFDPARDVALAPPAFLRTRGDERSAALAETRARNASRDVLAMHAEGGVSPPEYDVRRALSVTYAPDWWENVNRKGFVDDPRLLIRKKLSRAAHAEGLFRAKYCLVVEGYAPWTPRLAEAIKSGCVPAILSPAYRPPFSSILEWPSFSVYLRRDDVPNLVQVLEAQDYAKLHANLLKVRRLFSFAADPPPGKPQRWGPPDGLPLVVFEMWHRARAEAKRPADPPGSVSALAAAAGDMDESKRRGRLAPGRAVVPYSCAPDGESCVYDFHGVAWNCSSRTTMACACVKT